MPVRGGSRRLGVLSSRSCRICFTGALPEQFEIVTEIQHVLVPVIRARCQRVRDDIVEFRWQRVVGVARSWDTLAECTLNYPGRLPTERQSSNKQLIRDQTELVDIGFLSDLTVLVLVELLRSGVL